MSKTVTDIPKDSISGVKVMKHDLSQPVDSNTNLVDITNLIQIPQPELRYLGDDNLMVYTKGHSDEWLKHQPMLFMFRYKQRISRSKPYSGWVHPVDKDAATRWAGCNFYGGARMTNNLTPEALPVLTTEIDIPTNYNQKNGIKFPFNRYMFWKNDGNVYDQIPTGLDNQVSWKDFNTRPNEQIGWVIGRQGKQVFDGLAGYRRRKKKIQMFCFAFCIKRVERTGTQLGLSPMVFGPMSDVVMTMPGFSIGRHPNYQKNGIGTTRGANEIARLITMNNLLPIYSSTNGYDDSIYSNSVVVNDIIVKIKSMKKY